MRNRGLRNPDRNAIISGLIALGGIVSVWLGAREMDALGHETGRTAALIALGLLAAILGTAMFVNFMRALRIFRDMRSGRTAIARWTVPPDEFARYREIDRRTAERGMDNDYRPPRNIPPGGVEVIFSEDAVLIGGAFFGLTTTGLSRFHDVRMTNSDPPMIEFGTVLTTMSNLRGFRMHHHGGTLRVPVATEAALQGSKLASRFQDVIERRIIVKPNFWSGRMKAGLVIAVIAAVAAAAGFALAERNQELGNVPLVLAVAGTICALGGLVMTILAWALRQRQLHG